MPPAPVKAELLPIQKAEVHRIFEKKQSGNQTLLTQVRGAVDANLEAIRQTVEQNLYNELGVPPRLLESIDRIERSCKGINESVYSFNYFYPDRLYNSEVYAEVDQKGNLKRVYSVK